MVAGVCVLSILMVAFLLCDVCERIIPERVWDKILKLFGYQPEEG